MLQFIFIYCGGRAILHVDLRPLKLQTALSSIVLGKKFNYCRMRLALAGVFAFQRLNYCEMIANAIKLCFTGHVALRQWQSVVVLKCIVLVISTHMWSL